ncbi:MADS-box transcription factor PHERES 2-like [Impatiens glandulifera]|uniref:MADS-box transcription factor PHERES 2-like n=1 Tax=Impatiens glandulifera TaxID=253017 RepID=UPI001FB0B323|nr:MADS-box transcription factor PHERES 2-like [Impatiens glandulifera]
MDELNTLCGIEGCAIVYSQCEEIPEVWPNEEKAESVVARFNMMPNVNRHKGMENQELVEIGERMRALSVKSTLSLVQDSINPTRVNEDVAECSTSRMRLKDDEFVIQIEESDD